MPCGVPAGHRLRERFAKLPAGNWWEHGRWLPAMFQAPRGLMIADGRGRREIQDICRAHG